MSAPHQVAMVSRTFAAGVVTLSGETVSTVSEEKAGIRVNTDGTIDKIEGGTTTQIDTGTDWIIPNGAAHSLHEVRVTNVVDTGGDPGPWTDQAAADDIWIAITSNRFWSVQAVGPGGADSHGADFDLEIRFNGGAALASFAYSLFSEGG